MIESAKNRVGRPFRPITWGVLYSLICVGFAFEVAASSPSAPPQAAAPAAPSHAELRERVRKRMVEMATAKEEARDGARDDADASGPTSKEIAELFGQLREKEKNLLEREAALDLKTRDLEDRQKIMKEQLGKYENVIGKLRFDLKSLESSRKDKVLAFQQVYEKMEPKKAARILDDLDSDLVVKVLTGMRQQQVAEILSKMDPEKARRITKKLLLSLGVETAEVKP
jgi:flagellar motility protein MotE (MotC chaperone)